MLTCPNCGRESPDDFAFCPACAAPLAAPGTPHEVRKTVTVVFCDVTGSTALGERLDPESLRRIMSRYFAEMRAALERHGGTVEKFIGDAVMAVFGVPQLHEDDALRAVRAANDMRQALVLLNKELERDHGVTLAARIGVNTGDVVAGVHGDSLVTGDAVNVAARLEQAAPPGTVLLGADTVRLVRDAVVVEPVEPLELKGKSTPVEAFLLLEVVPGAAGIARRLDSSMVGRQRQLGQLSQAFEAATADHACQLFTVLGAPGVGKSRLVEEFLRGVDGRATVLRGRCLPYGDGITFFPVSEVVKEAAGLEDFDDPGEVERKICAVVGDAEPVEVCARLAQLFGVGETEAPAEETFWAIRRFLETVAVRTSLVVVFDDIQWGEPTFLELIDHIGAWSRDAPIVLLCMARPELLDERPTWGGGKLNATTISLDPLSEAESEELVANLLGRAALPDEARTRIVEAAEGTPLFVEAMLSMLIDDGFLTTVDGRWIATGDLAAVTVPPTVQAVIAARLERLGSAERSLIGRAAVAGQQFHVGALEALAGDGEPDVRATLQGLVRRDLIGPDRSMLAGDDAFRFRHLLIRDAAYDALPKAERASLHERFADWMLRVAGDRVEEQEEIVGYHLEQAFRLREAIGAGDRELAARAAFHLRASARRAELRGDPSAAANLFRRAAAFLPEDDPDRPLVLYELGRNERHVGDVRAALRSTEAAVATAAEGGQTALEWRARLERTILVGLVDPHAITTDDARAEIEEAIEVFERLEDDAGLASAWSQMTQLDWLPCRYDRAARSADRAIPYARRSEDLHQLGYALGLRTAAQGFGSMRPRDGLAAIAAIKDDVADESHQMIPVTEATYRAMLGDFDGARRILDEVTDRASRLGALFPLAGAWEWRAGVELFAGDAVAAERAARENYRILDDLGDEGHRSTSAGMLARVLCRLGRHDEAEPLARIAMEVAAPDDLISQVLGRSVQAIVLSARGNHDEAIALARASVGMFAEAEDPNNHGDLWLTLAEVLGGAGRTEQAAEAAGSALRLFEFKGNEPSAAAARTFLAALDA